MWVVEFREKEKNQEDQGEEVHGCYRWSAKRKVRKEERKKKKKRKERKKEEEGELCGTFWSLEEVVGKKRGKKEKNEKSKGTCVEGKKRRKCGTCVEEKKRGEKKRKMEGNVITIFSQ